MKKPILPDINQNFWQLGTIQGVALGLPGMIIPGADYLSAILGNCILWVIALPITLMAFKETDSSSAKRANAIENVKDFMGRTPCLISCFILSGAFLSWSLIQNKTSTISLSGEWGWGEKEQVIFGFILALLIGLMSSFGIRYIRNLCVYSLPVLFVIAIWMMTKTAPPSFGNFRTISFASVFMSASLVISENLPGIANLPTFFRHARSIPHVILGLTWMTVLVTFFQIFGIWIHVNSPADFFLAIPGHPMGQLIRTTFVLISLACINSVNIYFASAGLETISLIFQHKRNKLIGKIFYYFAFEHRVGRISINWGCGIIGIIGALACLLPESLSFTKALEEVADNILSNLGMILFFAFFMQLIIHHRHRILENVTAWLGWLVGSFASIGLQFKTQMDPITVTFIGILITTASFGVAIFFETNYWSAKKLLE